MYTDEQIMDSIVGSPTMTKAACDVIRGAIAQARSPFDVNLRCQVLSDAEAFAAFLPRKTLTVEGELKMVNEAFAQEKAA